MSRAIAVLSKEASLPAATTAAKRTLNVFIADDFPVVREGLRSLIDTQPDMRIVGEAEDGEVAWEQVRLLCRQHDEVSGDCSVPDVIVMDNSMPNVDGVEATRAIRRAYPQIKILAYSMHSDARTLRQLLSAGATGYVLKCGSTDKLLDAIRRVASGACYIDPALTDKVVDSLIDFPKPDREAMGVRLSEREMAALLFVAKGYTNSEIATQMHLSVKTVETYKVRGMKKLRMDSRVQLVRYALEEGWLETD